MSHSWSHVGFQRPALPAVEIWESIDSFSRFFIRDYLPNSHNCCQRGTPRWRGGDRVVESSRVPLLDALVNFTHSFPPSSSLPDAEGPVPKPDAPTQPEPREEPCVWEQRHPEEREISMDPDAGDGSRRVQGPGKGRRGQPAACATVYALCGEALGWLSGANSATVEIWRSHTGRDLRTQNSTLDICRLVC